MLNIIKGVQPRAQKVVVYGPEGIGKSTFASKFPSPLFIDTEGSTDHMDVDRLQKPTSWAMLMQMVKALAKTPMHYQTLVIDTIDWAEDMCVQHICAKNRKESIEDFGYGTGYVYLLDAMGELLNALESVIDAGVNVVFTAHCQIKKFEQPDELGAYDRYELKLGRKSSTKTSALIKEWADAVLFVNYKNNVIKTTNGKRKATQGDRVMYTLHTPAFDAKNRWGLEPKLTFDYTNIAAHIPSLNQPKANDEVSFTEPITTQSNEVSIDTLTINDLPQDMPQIEEIKDIIPKDLKDLMIHDKVTLAELKQTIADNGYYPLDTLVQDYAPNFVNGCLIAYWGQVVDQVKKLRQNKG